ncbi:zinc finger protein 729 [Takifugu rubripes]|uniref:zinc finger protein 729 n=1 Tax=Takifugu rubripes TaxID=31033 RepID=UPI001145F5F4|nr:zinc finger protein 729-like [Takifugu rubripes]
MDEGAAAITEDGGEGRPHGEDDTHQNYRQAKGTDGRVGVHCSQDYGEAFREEAPDLEHQQHQKKNTLVDDHSDTTTDAEAGVTDQLPQCQTERKDGENFSQEANAEIGGEITKRHAFECSHCGKSYGMIGHFLNHQRKHTKAPKSLSQDLEDLKKKSFQCEFCGRNYSRASALEAHLRCHEEKLVKPRNRDLEESPVTEETVIDSKPNKNQTLDTPDKPFTCACGKAFTAQMGLKTHQRFSRNSRCSPEDLAEKTKKPVSEFNCSECKKTFSSNIAFLNHQRWHANRSMNSSKRIPCEECGKVFMTLTFYHRHQRLVHSSETPAKSFLHQVCQLQKKAFECKECGLKFSRASALHSHELHHTDIFKETKKVAPPRSVSLNQQKSWESSAKDGEQEEAPPVHPVSTAEDVDADDTDGEECYGPGDFNVQVISASESEDEATQHANPDLELLCESDREAQDGDVVSPSAGVSKPKMDLKIVQIDLNTADAEDVAVAKETEVKKAEERFDCPDCSLWFSSAASLRIHRMWHDVRKRRQQTQGQSVTVYTHDTWGHDASSCAAHCSDIEQHENASTDHQALNQAEELGKKLTCNECGKCFSRLSALVSHQLHHPKRKEFQCPDCMTSYSHAATLFNHMKHCSSQKKENHLLNKRQYNPTKTLLGPKMFHCEQCGKAFWSLGAYSHHKQNQTQCADFRLRKGLPPVNGYPRCSAKVACPVCGRTFRHKGIMALHMRKHENGDHRCDICGRSFRLFSSLLRHQVVHSSQLLPPPVKSFQYQVEQLKKNTYSCPDCGKLFSRAKALQFHMKSHGYESGYSPSSLGSPVTPEDPQCATCLAHFNSKASLRAHQKLCIKKDVRIGHAVREEIVDVGAKETVAHAELNEKDGEGIKIETQTEAGGLENLYSSDNPVDGQPVVDRGPGQGVGFEEQLRNHKSKAKTRPYSCALCCQGFWTESQLNQHFIWHDEVRRRLPHEVRYRFSAAATPKTIRPSTPSADRGGKPLSFSSELNQESQSESSHKCQHCGKSFLSPAALEIHQSQYCNKDLYHCSICPRTFREIQELISHHQECLANFEIVE